MSNKKQAIAKFQKEIQERDKLVAEGLESYPVRLYKAIIKTKENGKEKTSTTYAVGGYFDIILDKLYILTEIRSTVAEISLIKHLDGKDFELLGWDIKLVEER